MKAINVDTRYRLTAPIHWGEGWECDDDNDDISWAAYKDAYIVKIKINFI